MQRNDDIAIAMNAVTHPEDYHDQPETLAIAWAVLMEARGKTVDLDRISKPAHIVRPASTTPLAEELASRLPRIGRKARDYAEAKGYRCSPFDGDAA